MNWEMEKVFDTRYIKLHFTLRMIETCKLPMNKASALRGGMGEMLLRANCIRDRQCEKCDFEEECIVQRTMYSKFKNKPESLNVGDSVGYIVECENYDEDFEEGAELKFNLILFGKTIVYFNQYMLALFALGQNGIGKDKARFVIKSVKNTMGDEILDGQNIYMKYYKTSTLREYVKMRLRRLDVSSMDRKIVFNTPVTIKHGGNFIKEFSSDAILSSLKRRLYIMAAFEDANLDEIESFYKSDIEFPIVVDQKVTPISVRRYSSRKDEGMYLNGIKGYVQFDTIDENILPMMLAGEVLHIGKNTSFGFGRYTVK